MAGKIEARIVDHVDIVAFRGKAPGPTVAPVRSRQENVGRQVQARDHDDRGVVLSFLRFYEMHQGALDIHRALFVGGLDRGGGKGDRPEKNGKEKRSRFHSENQ